MQTTARASGPGPGTRGEDRRIRLGMEWQMNRIEKGRMLKLRRMFCRFFGQSVNSIPNRHPPATRNSDSHESVKRPVLISAVLVSMATCGVILRLMRREPVPSAALDSESSIERSERGSTQPGDPKKYGRQSPRQSAATMG